MICRRLFAVAVKMMLKQPSATSTDDRHGQILESARQSSSTLNPAAPVSSVRCVTRPL